MATGRIKRLCALEPASSLVPDSPRLNLSQYNLLESRIPLYDAAPPPTHKAASRDGAL